MRHVHSVGMTRNGVGLAIYSSFLLWEMRNAELSSLFLTVNQLVHAHLGMVSGKLYIFD